MNEDQVARHARAEQMSPSEITGAFRGPGLRLGPVGVLNAFFLRKENLATQTDRDARQLLFTVTVTCCVGAG